MNVLRKNSRDAYSLLSLVHSNSTAHAGWNEVIKLAIENENKLQLNYITCTSLYDNFLSISFIPKLIVIYLFFFFFLKKNELVPIKIWLMGHGGSISCRIQEHKDGIGLLILRRALDEIESGLDN